MHIPKRFHLNQLEIMSVRINCPSLGIQGKLVYCRITSDTYEEIGLHWLHEEDETHWKTLMTKFDDYIIEMNAKYPDMKDDACEYIYVSDENRPPRPSDTDNTYPITTIDKLIYEHDEDPDHLSMIVDRHANCDETNTEYSQTANHGKAVVRTHPMPNHQTHIHNSIIEFTFPNNKQYCLVVVDFGKLNTPTFDLYEMYKMDKLHPPPPCLFENPSLFFQQLAHLFRSLIALRKDPPRTRTWDSPPCHVTDIKPGNMGWCPKSQSIRLFDIDYGGITPVYIPDKVFYDTPYSEGSPRWHVHVCSDLRTMLTSMFYLLLSHHTPEDQQQNIKFPNEWTSQTELYDILRLAQFPKVYHQILEGILNELIHPIARLQYINKYYLYDCRHYGYYWNDPSFVVDDGYGQRILELLERGMMAENDDTNHKELEINVYDPFPITFAMKARAMKINLRKKIREVFWWV